MQAPGRPRQAPEELAGEWQTSPPCSAAGTGLTHTSCHLCLPQLRGEQNYALPHSSYHTGAQEPTAFRTTSLTGGLINPCHSRSTDRPMDPTRLTGEAQSMRAKAPSSLRLSDKTNQLPGTSAPVTMGRVYAVIWGAIGGVDQRSDVILVVCISITLAAIKNRPKEQGQRQGDRSNNPSERRWWLRPEHQPSGW